MNKYLLDANIFIQAKNMHYGFDFCPAFWDWIIAKNADGEVYSIDKVYDELKDKGNELSIWANDNKSLFIPINSEIPFYLREISTWVASTTNYSDIAKHEFLKSADFYLIAYALAYKYTLVTHEVSSNSPNKIKIPNVCKYFNVGTMNVYTMLRTEQAKFVLGS